MTTTKTNAGNFFEDYKFGQILTHATPRTVTEGDRTVESGYVLKRPIKEALERRD